MYVYIYIYIYKRFAIDPYAYKLLGQGMNTFL